MEEKDRILEKNPRKLSEYRQREKERKRLSWKKRTEFREKRKMMGDVTEEKSKTKKVLTRSESEKQREYWRRKQAESRERRSSQTHRRYKEKDRHYRQDKRNNTESHLKRAQKKLNFPKDPEEFVNTVEYLVHNITPRKRKIMKEKNLLNTPTSRKKFFEKSYEVLKNSNKKNDSHLVKQKIIRNLSFLKKYRLSTMLARFLSVSDSYISKQSIAGNKAKQLRRDATSEQNKKVIQDYFQRCDVSTTLLTAKRVKKDNQERRVLDRPLAEVYKQFKEDHVDVKASFSTFVKNKPSNPWFGCLCESCANVDLKLKALAQVAARSGSTIKVKDKYEAVAITLCEKDEGSAFHKLQCIQRQCLHCGCDGIVRYYQPLAEQNCMATVVYSKWERVKKQYKGKEVTQIMPVSHTGSVTEVVLNLSEELKTFAEHLFVAAWQQKQFLMLQKNVPKSWAILNMDFAENYTCVAQREVQSAHWSHNQVTVHPTVAYYRCQEEGCEDIVTEHLIFVSDDKVHDAAAVQEFVKLANQHLIQKRGVPFTDISCSQADFGFSFERHFYGSRHGKGPSDGAGAVVKSAVRRAVMGGNVVVNDANEFFEIAKQKLSKEDTDHKEHFKRTIFLVTDINHDRPERSDKCCKTLKGTRKVQAVQAVEKMIINTRNLSCFCEFCINGVEQTCVNSNYVHEWKNL
ncbi:hypothetical protein MAR_032463 [Mya arenaria]|uniref:Uncharacterized protein n=1 Tax=Mya arenaria TaxID=6604 RepID=A0ABY7FAQ4_MYAAR|nr:hypothetical protein MAR_032463 [Mya arenaria]